LENKTISLGRSHQRERRRWLTNFRGSSNLVTHRHPDDKLPGQTQRNERRPAGDDGEVFPRRGRTRSALRETAAAGRRASPGRLHGTAIWPGWARRCDGMRAWLE